MISKGDSYNPNLLFCFLVNVLLFLGKKTLSVLQEKLMLHYKLHEVMGSGRAILSWILASESSVTYFSQ